MYRNNFNLGDENMDITLIFKVAGVGILISVIVLGLVIGEISDLFNTVRTMFKLY